MLGLPCSQYPSPRLLMRGRWSASLREKGPKSLVGRSLDAGCRTGRRSPTTKKQHRRGKSDCERRDIARHVSVKCGASQLAMWNAAQRKGMTSAEASAPSQLSGLESVQGRGPRSRHCGYQGPWEHQGSAGTRDHQKNTREHQGSELTGEACKAYGHRIRETCLGNSELRRKILEWPGDEDPNRAWVSGIFKEGSAYENGEARPQGRTQLSSAVSSRLFAGRGWGLLGPGEWSGGPALAHWLARLFA